MRAIICGAGISGLTMAWWLQRDGWEVTVLDKVRKLRGEGYMLDFFGSGWDVAAKMGLISKLEASRYPIAEVQWIDRKLRIVAKLKTSQIAKVLDGKYVSLMRGDLEKTLFDALSDKIDFRFGTTIDDLTSATRGVVVRLTNRAVEHADILVGADGVHSLVRAKAFGSESHFFRFMGYHTAAFIFEDAALASSLGQEFRLMCVPGRQVGFYPLRDGRIASFFVHGTQSPALPRNPLDELNRVYGDLGWLVPAALGAAKSLPSIYYDQVAQIEMPHWSQRRVVLIGDASMTVSLLAGQGASMGMASAFCLAEALREEPSIEGAFKSFERRLRTPVRKKQRAGRQTAVWLVPPTALQIFVRNAVMRMAELPIARGLLAKMFLSESESIIPL